jgi:hypothetical protein
LNPDEETLIITPLNILIDNFYLCVKSEPLPTTYDDFAE